MADRLFQVFFIRAHQEKTGATTTLPTDWQQCRAPEVLEAFMGQFYDNKMPPRQILLSG
jgi:excinuclease ABC subunit C